MLNSTHKFDEFIRVRCHRGNMDRYYDRVSIVEALNGELKNLHGTLLDIGCGASPYRDLVLSPPSQVTKYIGLDLAGDRKSADPPMQWDGHTIPLDDQSVQSALATEVLEHCPHPDRVLSEIFRVLSRNGILVLTVPFFWPMHEVPNDEFRYTPFALTRLLSAAGFQDVRVDARGGWDASLATMLGLWIERRPMTRIKRRILQAIAMPIYTTLLRCDSIPWDFGESCMVTGLTAVGKK